MNSGRSIRLKAFFLLSLLLLQVLAALACVAASTAKHGHGAQARHAHAATQQRQHHCCTEASIQLVKTDKLGATAPTLPASPAPFLLHPVSLSVIFLLNNRPVLHPVAYLRYKPHSPIADIRIAIRSFQI